MTKSIFSDSNDFSLDSVGSEAELIPLMTSEDEEALEKEELPEVVSLLPIKNTVLFPGVVIPITVGRDKSIQLIKDANKSKNPIGVVAQKDKKVEDPAINDLYQMGTVAQILRVLKMPDGSTTIIIQGKKRFKIDNLVSNLPYLKVKISSILENKKQKKESEFKLTVESIKETAIKIINENQNIPSEASFAIKNIQSDSFLINFVSSNMNLTVNDKQKILSSKNISERALLCLKYINLEYQELELKNDIQSRVRNDLDQQQREYYLHQQMKTIQEELGGHTQEEEIEELRKRASKKLWSDKVQSTFEKEISKLQRMNPQVAEFSVQRNYIDLLLDLPWNHFSTDNFDLKRSEKVLNRDHFGLDEVKKRIIEYLAVLKLRNDMKSPIICLHGPPGVGKTSLGKSIAEAIGREYVRVSLGGLKDESEIRGHRKTYIGAMPGRIIQNIKKTGTSNPVFVLDEIDKVGFGSQGDPSSALLEVLDPEQNSDFYDNFLELGYDLSKVMFIATSNNILSINPALRDRMEFINISGYTLEEKTIIAKKYLVPKQLKEHGLNKKDFILSKPIIEVIIDKYTRESGVRGLEKQIAKSVRYAAKSVAMDEKYSLNPSKVKIKEILGPQLINREVFKNNNKAGVVVGLAWTSAGGEILFIESALSSGKGQLSITGNLGKIMKESATIALEYIKSNADLFDLSKIEFDKYNVHIHIPEGATPKDGPSAGITMLTSLVSLFSQKKVKKYLSMTGEITLRGKVLPVGGIKEKILAAKRSKIKEIILSEENKKDVELIPKNYLQNLNLHYVSEMRDVIKLSVTDETVSNPKNI
ncbi:MAG: endopeptidase La [Flavobacteriales bacterium TMED96]|nr:MAG: endopeptidase La [Flavobacteriales bacterium TMED96]